MTKKSHGTSNAPVQQDLRWNCDVATADRICNFNRHYAERSGYWQSTSFLQEATKEYEQNGEVKFYDSNTGKLLFVAPKGRSMDAFLNESKSHGWPSFRDEEVVWDEVRCLPNGEAVSVDGTHLGHNLPDSRGSRYCINLVSVAGKPTDSEGGD
jgi:peptide methionine sulfoxide reductase MsrB